jgi:hypothetical protein
MEVAVLNCCVTDTKATRCLSKVSMILLGECHNIAPELLPGGTFLGGKIGKFFFVAHSIQIGIGLPVLHIVLDARHR